jgi:hypothetical protein
MGDKILESTKTIEELVKKINEIVDSDFSMLEHENDIEKWNTIPKLLLMEDDKKNKMLSFVEFLDTLLVSLEAKAMYIISLSGLLEFGNINLLDYDDGSLFTLADYYQNSSVEEIKKTLSIVGNKDLLLAVRNKTLDLDVRKKIISNIISNIETNKTSIIKTQGMKNYITELIKQIPEKDYYDLVK